MKPTTGVVFNIQRFSLHDGPGIRTTVFFKGCNLRCIWCHNPESFELRPQLSFNRQQCTGCGACGKEGQGDDKNVIPFSCVETCPSEALTVIGKAYTVDEVMEVVLKDKVYYKDTGGVTFSGGEPTLQYDFLMELLVKSKANNLHTCLETNGIISQDKLINLCNYVDLFLLDFKHSDDRLHKEYTGSSNCSVLKSLKLLNKFNANIILRCPIIPGINDSDAHFAEINRLKKLYPSIREVELMPYHEYGVSKWDNIGITYELPYASAPSKEQIAIWNGFIALQPSGSSPSLTAQ